MERKLQLLLATLNNVLSIMGGSHRGVSLMREDAVPARMMRVGNAHYRYQRNYLILRLYERAISQYVQQVDAIEYSNIMT